jgi:protein-disulfide isomerase
MPTRFWEMHDLLFQNQNALKHKNLLAYAERLSLEMDQFRGDLKGEVYQDRVHVARQQPRRPVCFA